MPGSRQISGLAPLTCDRGGYCDGDHPADSRPLIETGVTDSGDGTSTALAAYESHDGGSSPAGATITFPVNKRNDTGIKRDPNHKSRLQLHGAAGWQDISVLNEERRRASFQNLTIITNALKIAAELAETAVEVILTGGLCGA